MLIHLFADVFATVGAVIIGVIPLAVPMFAVALIERRWKRAAHTRAFVLAAIRQETVSGKAE